MDRTPEAGTKLTERSIWTHFHWLRTIFLLTTFYVFWQVISKKRKKSCFFLKSEKSKIRILEHWSYDRIRIRIISWRWRYRPVYCIICWLVSESALKTVALSSQIYCAVTRVREGLNLLYLLQSGPKSKPQTLLIFIKKNYFTDTLCGKIAIKWLLSVSLHYHVRYKFSKITTYAQAFETIFYSFFHFSIFLTLCLILDTFSVFIDKSKRYYGK